MRATATFITGLALVVRFTGAMPASTMSLRSRQFGQCQADGDCPKGRECVTTRGNSWVMGGAISNTECSWIAGYNECETDDDCEGEFEICKEAINNSNEEIHRMCRPEGLYDQCSTDDECLRDLVCDGVCSLAKSESAEKKKRESNRLPRETLAETHERLREENRVNRLAALASWGG